VSPSSTRGAVVDRRGVLVVGLPIGQHGLVATMRPIVALSSGVGPALVGGSSTAGSAARFEAIYPPPPRHGGPLWGEFAVHEVVPVHVYITYT